METLTLKLTGNNGNLDFPSFLILLKELSPIVPYLNGQLIGKISLKIDLTEVRFISPIAMTTILAFFHKLYERHDYKGDIIYCPPSHTGVCEYLERMDAFKTLMEEREPSEGKTRWPSKGRFQEVIFVENEEMVDPLGNFRLMTEMYTIEDGSPPAFNWNEYKSALMVRWNELIGSKTSNIEKNIQLFLEENPCLIPGSFGISFSSGHFPFPGAVITQPILKGLATKAPDFMWIASDSAAIYPILIEIETPEKRWFTKEGVPHSDFTQAHAQLISWKTWFNSPVNQQIFLQYYEIPVDLYQTRRIHPLYVLIYGSRSEFVNAPKLNAMRGHLHGEDETLMTFDRLTPEEKAQNMMCVRIVDSVRGRYYRALTVPPTLTLGPLVADYRAKVLDKEEAVQRNSLISPERKNFLIRRIPYWDKWARNRHGFHSINSGDTE